MWVDGTEGSGIERRSFRWWKFATVPSPRPDCTEPMSRLDASSCREQSAAEGNDVGQMYARHAVPALAAIGTNTCFGGHVHAT